jgi:hypothetical protein
MLLQFYLPPLFLDQLVDGVSVLMYKIHLEWLPIQGVMSAIIYTHSTNWELQV